MGLATQTTIGVGIMGIGYNSSEANVATGNGTVYPNLPFAMADAGLIKANAYSLWLNDIREYSTSISTITYAYTSICAYIVQHSIR
jgi:hypothetical protein